MDLFGKNDLWLDEDLIVFEVESDSSITPHLDELDILGYGEVVDVATNQLQVQSGLERQIVEYDMASQAVE